MDFTEAVEAMKEGKNITREDIGNKDYRIFLNNDKICYSYNAWGGVNIYHITIKDIEAIDWKIWEDNRPLYEKRHNDTEFNLVDVKKKLKEFIECLIQGKEEHSPVRKKAEELFGKELI